MPATILIRGAGDLASGVALRLVRSGLNVVMTELAEPLAVRRTVSFAEAVFEGRMQVENVTARRVEDPTDTLKIRTMLSAHQIPVLIDPSCSAAINLRPLVIVDARMLKYPPEPFHHAAALYIGLGPGFVAPATCHAVIETARGHAMGRVIFDGSARDDTATPEGDARRVLRSPADGILVTDHQIGDRLEAGKEVAAVAGQPIRAPFMGTLRGLLRPGTRVRAGIKIGDIDAREDPALYRTVSDKSLAVGGGVLEAILSRPEARRQLWP